MISEDMRDARQEVERDLESGAIAVHCPACGKHDCEVIRGFGGYVDYQCECGWRFRADSSGRVVREFGFESFIRCPICGGANPGDTSHVRCM